MTPVHNLVAQIWVAVPSESYPLRKGQGPGVGCRRVLHRSGLSPVLFHCRTPSLCFPRMTCIPNANQWINAFIIYKKAYIWIKESLLWYFSFSQLCYSSLAMFLNRHFLIRPNRHKYVREGINSRGSEWVGLQNTRTSVLNDNIFFLLRKLNALRPKYPIET